MHFIADCILKDDLHTTGSAFLPSVVVRDCMAHDPGMSRAALKRLSQSQLQSQMTSLVYTICSLSRCKGNAFALLTVVATAYGLLLFRLFLTSPSSLH